eukprot:scaffold2349_cov407-Prasinococcus_capsulatus_cf.AAC.6
MHECSKDLPFQLDRNPTSFACESISVAVCEPGEVQAPQEDVGVPHHVRGRTRRATAMTALMMPAEMCESWNLSQLTKAVLTMKQGTPNENMRKASCQSSSHLLQRHDTTGSGAQCPFIQRPRCSPSATACARPINDPVPLSVPQLPVLLEGGIGTWWGKSGRVALAAKLAGLEHEGLLLVQVHEGFAALEDPRQHQRAGHHRHRHQRHRLRPASARMASERPTGPTSEPQHRLQPTLSTRSGREDCSAARTHQAGGGCVDAHKGLLEADGWVKRELH